MFLLDLFLLLHKKHVQKSFRSSEFFFVLFWHQTFGNADGTEDPWKRQKQTGVSMLPDV